MEKTKNERMERINRAISEINTVVAKTVSQEADEYLTARTDVNSITFYFFGKDDNCFNPHFYAYREKGGDGREYVKLSNGVTNTVVPGTDEARMYIAFAKVLMSEKAQNCILEAMKNVYNIYWNECEE